MIKFDYKGQEHTFRNEGNEVTLAELGRINNIMTNDDNSFFDKWLEVISFLGSDGLSEIIDEQNLLNIIENFNATKLDTAIHEEITVNNRAYKCNLINGTIQLTGRQLALIERNIRSKKEWAGHVFAIIYEDVELTNKEHNEQAHIDHKANLFLKEITSDIASPVIFQINKRLVDNFERMAKINAKS